MKAPTPRANDYVTYAACRWRVIVVTTAGEPGVPARLRLVRVIEVDETEVTATGETADTRRGRVRT